MLTDEILSCIKTLLEQQGIENISAWPPSAAVRYEAPLAVTALRSMEMSDHSFGDYLGSFEDETGLHQRYGKNAKVAVALDLYCPAESDGGMEQLESLFALTVNALVGMGGTCLALQRMEAEETAYDEKSQMYKRKVTVHFTAPVEAVVSGDESSIVDFRLGEILINGNDYSK